MNTNEIRCILSKDSKTREIFIDVFPMDKFRNFIHQNQFMEGLYIINDENSDSAGNHWISLFRKMDKLYFIDSFAKSPSYYSLEDITQPFKNVHAVPHKIQHIFSDVCGEYVIFFAYHLSRGKYLRDILKYFSHDCKNNDTMVKQFVHKYFPGHSR